MRFTIRDMLLFTALVAVSLGWWIDRGRLAARDAEWKERFEEEMVKLSMADGQEYFFDTPDGPWSVNRKPDPKNKLAMP